MHTYPLILIGYDMSMIRVVANWPKVECVSIFFMQIIAFSPEKFESVFDCVSGGNAILRVLKWSDCSVWTDDFAG